MKGKIFAVVLVVSLVPPVLVWARSGTIKYEEVYLRAYRSVSEARRGLGRYLAFYNRRQPHSALGGQTPDQAYFNQPKPIQAAA